MFFFDTNYLILVLLPTILLSGLAQLYIRSTYAKWGNTRNGSGMSGPEVAQRIMLSAGLTNVGLDRVEGDLTDHFDPRTNVVRMSTSVANSNSVASMAIVAHELGHAQQYQQRSPLIAARSFLLPAVQISPTISYGLIFLGLIMNISGLAWLGVGVFGIAVLFMILTLPVEIDASMRGLRLLRESGVMSDSEDITGARQMLTAAAFTYIAAAITSILTLLYYISLVQRDR